MDTEELLRLRTENVWLKSTIRHMEHVKAIAQERENTAKARMLLLEAELGRMRQSIRDLKRELGDARANLAALPDAVVRVLHSE